MQRLTGERGAVSVVMALLMVPLIGFAAIAVDVAAMYAERQQLQAGADAAALAIAQDCARDDCLDPAATAQVMSNANVNAGDATATVTDPALTPATGRVTVEAASTSRHLFAPVFELLEPGTDYTESTLNVAATAAWGYPTGGRSMLPLALHQCEFFAQLAEQGGDLSSPSPTMLTILRSKDLSHTELPADWPCSSTESGNPVPGGFGWLDTDPGTCWATTGLDGDVTSDPGNSIPSSCDTADLVALQDSTFLLPLFDTYGGQGNNAWYNVVGYAAFTLKGYDIVGKSGQSWGVPCPKTVNTCISGYFERFVDISDDFVYSPGAPQFGAAAVSLVK